VCCSELKQALESLSRIEPIVCCSANQPNHSDHLNQTNHSFFAWFIALQQITGFIRLIAWLLQIYNYSYAKITGVSNQHALSSMSKKLWQFASLLGFLPLTHFGKRLKIIKLCYCSVFAPTHLV